MQYLNIFKGKNSESDWTWRATEGQLSKLIDILDVLECGSK